MYTSMMSLVYKSSNLSNTYKRTFLTALQKCKCKCRRSSLVLLVVKDEIIIYDGLCGLCDKAVRIVLFLDKKKNFHYTSLQGEYVKTLQVDSTLDSIVFSEEGMLYYKSTAILKILQALGGLWKLSFVFYLIPKGVRDWAYDILAKYRYKIFTRREHCRLPTKEESPYFLD